jgi:succinoglycan biosynthesis transport protein ExoP
MPDDDTDWNVEWAAPAAPVSNEQALDRPAGSRAAGSVGFCDEGLVSPGNAVAILESLNDSSSSVAEEMRLLAAKVHDIRRERGIACLALTSTGPGEGKSTISLGLAAALAREPGRRILLVEADLRRPSLAATLGLPPAPGLGEWLNGAFEYVPVRLVQPGGFFLLVAGKVELERPELLGSSRMDNLLRAARGLFDFVILDATPLLPVADAVLIQDLVDAFLMVVRSRQTSRDAIRDALARLRPDRVIGLILNEHHEPRSSYMTQAYQRYGMSYETSPNRSRRGR